MNIHEYQAKELFKIYGILVPDGIVVDDPKDIGKALLNFKTDLYVVKAQIHAGGRGKAGGVKITKDHNEAVKIAAQMFGTKLFTHQTRHDGQEIRKVYIESGVAISKEYYISLIIDRDSGVPVFIVSTEGGIDIEKVALENPEKIIKVYINNDKVWDFHARKIGLALGLKKEILKNFTDTIARIYRLFIDLDASQIEINPLVVTEKNELMALDAKINFDDNALFRHKQILALLDEDEEDPLELKAKKTWAKLCKNGGNDWMSC